MIRAIRPVAAFSFVCLIAFVPALFRETALRAAGGNERVTMIVHAQRPGRSVAKRSIGVNTAAWDGSLTDRVIPGRLHAAGVTLLRFPGGSTADEYDWRNNSVVPGQTGGTDPNASFDRFIRLVVKPAHAKAIVTVNYGSSFSGKGGGSPAQAAAWVAHADRIAPKAVPYWEIGNEVYGNGYYGARWETDLHRSHSPATYGANAVRFIRAMKRVNRRVKVGVVVTAPGNWPDGQGPEQWNRTVLRRTCRLIDFVSVHWYAQNPGQESDARLLASPYGSTPSSRYPLRKMLRLLRADLVSSCGRRGSHLPIFMTETNSVSSNPGKQTTSLVNGLFLVEDYLESLSSGAATVMWWTLHNGAYTTGNNRASLYGHLDYGDYGLLTDGQRPETSTDQPFPTYIALRLLSRGLRPGAHFLAVKAAPSIHAYALRQKDRMDVFVINPSPVHVMQLHTLLRGMEGPLKARALQLGPKTSRIRTVSVHVHGAAVQTALPAYTAELITVTHS